MADMILNNNEDAREAIRLIAAENNQFLTSWNASAGIGQGTLTRFVNKHSRVRVKDNHDPELYVSTFLKALDFLGYEVVVRPKVSGSRRTQRLRALKQRSKANVGEGAAGSA